MPSAAASFATEMAMAHVPVLTQELLDLLDVRPDSCVVDCTFGAGGHAAAVASRLGPDGLLIACDRDPLSEEYYFSMRDESSTARLASIWATSPTPCAGCARRACARLTCTWIWASAACSWTRRTGAFPTATTPRSTCAWTPRSRSQQRTSSTPGTRWRLRTSSGAMEKNDTHGGSHGPWWPGAAGASSRIPPSWSTPSRWPFPRPPGSGPVTPLGACSKHLRIEVNDELNSLRRSLPEAFALLDRGGILAVISFHSLEDRIVKEFFVGKARACTCPPGFPVCVCGGRATGELLGSKAVVPGTREIALNPRSSSAKLRALRKF